MIQSTIVPGFTSSDELRADLSLELFMANVPRRSNLHWTLSAARDLSG